MILFQPNQQWSGSSNAYKHAGKNRNFILLSLGSAGFCRGSFCGGIGNAQRKTRRDDRVNTKDFKNDSKRPLTFYGWIRQIV